MARKSQRQRLIQAYKKLGFDKKQSEGLADLIIGKAKDKRYKQFNTADNFPVTKMLNSL